MLLHVHQSVGADLVELIGLNLAQLLNVVAAPLKLRAIVSGACFTLNILHFQDDVLRGLAAVDGL